MAGRWTFVLVALACAMVAQSIPDLVKGDRLNIFCTEEYTKFEKEIEKYGKIERLTGVLIGQGSTKVVVGLDERMDGVMTMTFDKMGLFHNPKCLVKTGIVWKTGDWLEITGTAGTKFEWLNGQIGRLGEWKSKRSGFEVALEGNGDLLGAVGRKWLPVIPGAYLVKSSYTFTTMDEKMAFEGYFSHCDQNGDGQVDEGEFLGWGRIVEDTHHPGSAFHAGTWFGRFDKNVDQQLSPSEFLTYWREQGWNYIDFGDHDDDGDDDDDFRRLSEQTAVQV